MVETREAGRAEHASASPEQRLRSAGLRVTAPRLAVLDVVAEHPHADAAAVLERTRERTRGVSVQGVYDVLTALTDAGLLRRLQPGHSVARYELDTGDNHHPVVCRSCQTITDVPCTTGQPPCLDTSHPESAGFVVDEAEVIFWGMCPRCRETSEDAHQTTTTTEKPTKKKEQV